jgi:hypothetical protein
VLRYKYAEAMASGYLIPTRFDVLYAAAIQKGTYNENPAVSAPIYGIPHQSSPSPSSTRPQYRGIDREPLSALSFENARIFTEAGTPCEATDATALLDEIEVATGREDGWVTDEQSARRVWDALGEAQSRYEVIFAKEYTDTARPPDAARFLGCDAAYFVSDHFSCICDALFLPRWHGTDPEGALFRPYFDKLNAHGLFDTNEQALDYLRYYLSFEWTERADNFTSIEVYSVIFAVPHPL